MFNNEFRNKERPPKQNHPVFNPNEYKTENKIKPDLSLFKNDYRSQYMQKNKEKKKPKIEQRPLLAKIDERPSLPLTPKTKKPEVENTRWPPPGHGQNYQEPAYGAPHQIQRPKQIHPVPQLFQPSQPQVVPQKSQLFEPAKPQVVSKKPKHHQPPVIPQNGYLASQPHHQNRVIGISKEF